MLFGALVPHIEIHGGIRRYFEMGNELVKRGHRFHLYCQRFRTIKSPWLSYQGLIFPYDEARKYNHDVLFTGANECFKSLARLEAKTKIVLVVAKFYADAYEDFLRQEGKDFLWIGVSGDWKEPFKIPKPNGFTVCGGVNTNFFKPDFKKKTKKIKVVFYGRTPSSRGGDFLCKSIRIIRQISSAHKVDFIAYDRGILQQSILESSVRFAKISSQNDLLELLQSSHIIVSAMHQAGWNNVVAEGMSCGMAALTTEAGTRDFVFDDSTGKVFKLGDEESFINALYFYLKNPQKMREIAKKGQRFIQEFSWEKFIDGFLACISGEEKIEEIRETKKATLINAMVRTQNLDEILDSIAWQKIDPSKFEIITAVCKDEVYRTIKKKIDTLSASAGLNWRVLRMNGASNCESRNKAARYATGDLLIFADGDQILSQNFISEHLKNYSEKTVGIGIINIEARQRDNKIVVLEAWKAGMSMGEKFIPERSFSDFTKNLTPEQAFSWASFHNKKDPTDYINVITRNCAIDKKSFLQIGGFDESFGYSEKSPSRGWEDVEFGLRAHEAGFKFVFVPCWAVHIAHPRFSKDNGVLNCVKMIKKHPWFIEKRKDWFDCRYDINDIRRRCELD